MQNFELFVYHFCISRSSHWVAGWLGGCTRTLGISPSTYLPPVSWLEGRHSQWVVTVLRVRLHLKGDGGWRCSEQFEGACPCQWNGINLNVCQIWAAGAAAKADSGDLILQGHRSWGPITDVRVILLNSDHEVSELSGLPECLNHFEICLKDLWDLFYIKPPKSWGINTLKVSWSNPHKQEFES